MNDTPASLPPALAGILQETIELGFNMASEPKTGALLRSLAASKPGGKLLELGTGTGISTAWLLAGMDGHARLETVDVDPTVVAVAQRYLAHDPRVSFHVGDGAAFVSGAGREQFDLVFADAWPGKFTHLNEALSLLRPGGIYVIDDLLPQANWPPGHGEKVASLMASLETREGWMAVTLSWASGIMMVTRLAAPLV